MNQYFKVWVVGLLISLVWGLARKERGFDLAMRIVCAPLIAVALKKVLDLYAN